MDSRQHRMAGRFCRELKDGKFSEYEDKLVVRVVRFNKINLSQSDVNHICNFYNIPCTENWFIEGNDWYNFNIIIRKTKPDTPSR